MSLFFPVSSIAQPCAAPSAPLCGVAPAAEDPAKCIGLQREHALAILDRAARALRRGEHDRALAALEQAEAICPSPQPLYIRARILMERAHHLDGQGSASADDVWLQALAAATQYLAQVPTTQWTRSAEAGSPAATQKREERAAFIQTLLCEHGRRFALLCIHDTAGKGAQVDGQAVALTGGRGAVWLRPGGHQVALGGPPQRVMLVAGQWVESAPPPPAQAPPPAALLQNLAPAPAPATWPHRSWLAWVIGGAAALSTGVVLLGLGGNAAALNGTCTESAPACGLLYDGRAYAIGGFTSGAVLTIGGAALLGRGLWLRRASHRSSH